MSENNQIENVIESLKDKIPTDLLENLSPEELKEKAGELLKNVNLDEIGDKINLDDIKDKLNLDDLSDDAKNLFGNIFGGDKK